MTLPLFLTWLRIAAIPLLVLVYLFAPFDAARPLSAWIFGLAAATDFLDGLSGAAVESTIIIWRISRSGGRQAYCRCGIDAAGLFQR